MNCPNLKQKYEELLTLQADFRALNAKFQQMKPNTVAERRAVSDELLVRQREIEGLIKENFAELMFISVEKARVIMDRNVEAGKTHCLGPEEIERAFGMKLDKIKIPKIPFSKQELGRAEEEGKFLILRVDVDDDGDPLTMAELEDMMLHNFSDDFGEGAPKGKIINNRNAYVEEEWWKNDPMELRWALVSIDPLKDSTSMNYFQQITLLMKHLLWIYREMEMPEKYQKAIAEFIKYGNDNFFGKTDDEIDDLISNDNWDNYAQEFSKLQLNDLLRKTPTEDLYDELAYFQINDERLNKNKWNWTKRIGSNGGLVAVGYYNSSGIDVYAWAPEYRPGNPGVFSSCS